LAAIFHLTIAAILLLMFAAVASASMGGTPTPAGEPPPPGSVSGSPATAPSTGTLSLASARATPRKSFYYGFHNPSLRFTIGSTHAQNDLQIDVVNTAGEVVRSFYRNDVAPGATLRIRWDGTTSAGRPARNGSYSFRVGAQGSVASVARRAATSSEPLSLGFDFYGYTFPILGRHDFGGAAGRFGAPRSGHTHQGQDVMATCGLPEVAARGGTVQYSGYGETPATTSSSMARAPRSTSCMRTWPNHRR